MKRGDSSETLIVQVNLLHLEFTLTTGVRNSKSQHLFCPPAVCCSAWPQIRACTWMFGRVVELKCTWLILLMWTSRRWQVCLCLCRMTPLLCVFSLSAGVLFLLWPPSLPKLTRGNLSFTITECCVFSSHLMCFFFPSAAASQTVRVF